MIFHLDLAISFQVFSIAQKRWIHVDPSDNVVDAPLMYQYGWKRDIDYIIAFSRDDVQDVTWKYCSDHGRVSRRTTRRIAKRIFE